VQRLRTQLDQYTDLDEAQKEKINTLLPEDDLRALRSSYLETAQRLKAQQGKSGEDFSEAQEKIEQLDFEFVLFSSALIDYDYIMGLIARYSQEKPSKQTMSREQLVNMLTASSNLMDEREDIIAYINSLQAGQGLSEQEIKDGYQAFKAQKADNELAELAGKHSLNADTLKAFVEAILDRMIFDGEQLSDLFQPLELGWKARTKAELSLMDDLVPFLKKQAQGREISGLAAYE
jgi:type I restriction enzyme R subunit